MSDQEAAAIEAPAPQQEVSETDAMAAVWDRLQSEGQQEEAPEQPEEPEAAPEPEKADAASPEPEETAEEQEEAPAAAEPPSELPAALKAKWADMPEDAREAVLSSHRELSRKLADQGRVVSASKPVYDVLVQAAQEIPTLKDMTPDQIARDVFQMAQIQGQLAQDPVNTLLGIAERYGALDGIKQAIAGEKVGDAARENMELAQEIRALKTQLAQVADPSLIEQRVTQTLTARDTERMVADFAKGQAHWQDVEPVMPQFIPVAQNMLGEGASAQDVLSQAYDMAIHAIPELRAKANGAAQPAPAAADPKRTEAALKAKSVNVKSSGPTKAKPVSERQAMEAVWDKYHT